MNCKYKRANILFINAFIFVILLGDIALVRTEKNISSLENRQLNKFQHFTFVDYINGSYQDSLEHAFEDQFILSNYIKENFKIKLTNYNKIPDYICKNKYVSLNGYYSFDCDKALISKYDTLDENTRVNILNRLQVYSELNKNIDMYYYFISTPAIYNFEKNEYSINVEKIIDSELKGEYLISYLKFKDYAEYSKLFYKTDHHWNYYGSYNGYKDIINMILPEDEKIKVTEKLTFEDIIFYGSSARISHIFDFKEHFTVYKFDLPNYTVIRDKTHNSYGDEQNYYDRIYYKDKLANHYGNFYGGDNGEVIFDFNNMQKPNLMILGSSFTNAINKLVASHFNRTFVVDLRHYTELTSESFDIYKYIETNKIDKVLIIMDYGFLKDQSFNIDGGL